MNIHKLAVKLAKKNIARLDIFYSLAKTARQRSKAFD